MRYHPKTHSSFEMIDQKFRHSGISYTNTQWLKIGFGLPTVIGFKSVYCIYCNQVLTVMTCSGIPQNTEI